MTGTNPAPAEQPLRILMTADAVGGVWRYSVDLIAALAAEGARVLLATMGPRPSDDQRSEIAAIPNASLAESDYALEWMSDPWRDVDAAGDWLLHLADEFGADLVHLNGYVHAALPWRRPVVVVAHSCVFSWWKAVHGEVPDSAWDEYKKRVPVGLAAASRVIAPSGTMARCTAEEYGVPPEKISVIHNFSSTASAQRARKEPFFLAAGRLWDEAKNIRVLERIASELDWEVRLSGNGPTFERATTAGKGVRYLGVLRYAELLDQMAAASVFVHPALYEPFGLSVLEAARQGCCLVLADIPSLRELWEDAAIFVNPRNPDEWVRALNGISSDPSRCSVLGACARVHAGRYDGRTSLAEYLRVYRSLLSHRYPSAAEVAA